MKPLSLALLVALALGCAGVGRSQSPAHSVTSPQAHLARSVGADFHLADWHEVSSYFERLAAESPCVQLTKAGKTTEGRDFLVAAIASATNLARIEEIQRLAATIADPRGHGDAELARALEVCPPIVMISNAMHSTETAAPQFAMELAWRLATSGEEPYASAREKLVVLVLPCTNPDGLDHVVAWYRATVGTPHEASSLPELYQHYAGHDNNRDGCVSLLPHRSACSQAPSLGDSGW